MNAESDPNAAAAVSPVVHRRVLTGWGRTAPSAAEVWEVGSEKELGTAMQSLGRRGVVARGLGRSYGDAAQNGGGHVLDMTSFADAGHRRVAPPSDHTGRVRVPAGVSIGRLMHELVPAGWFVPVCPGTRHVTVGGAIASDVHGKNHHRRGSFASHVVDARLRLADGTEITIGPDEFPEAFWATTGGMGLTGVITEATVQMIPIETSAMSVDIDRTGNLDETMDRLAEVRERREHAVAWLDLLTPGSPVGRGVVTAGDHAPLDELPQRHRAHPLQYRQAPAPSAAPWPGVRVVNRATMRAFNELKYRRAPKQSRGVLQGIAQFFHPLDAVANWNHLYGRCGLVQYQFAVPTDEVAVIRKVVHRLHATGAPTFLAVLKYFGSGTGAPLSFPIPGWTLSLDLPADAPGLGPLLDQFDEEVAASGGRVYLAKDGRMCPEILPAMYPDLPRWREVRDRLDPARSLQSDLGRRLGLVEVP